ncbi:MAG: HAD family hydrolase [Anaerolineales bacterium]
MTLILFDFDGVLADTLDDLIKFGQETCNELGVRHHVVKEDLSTLEVMSFSTYGKQLEVPDHLIEEFVKRCLAKVAGKESPPEIFTGLAEVIRNLSVNNTLGIVTTNSAQNVKLFLSKHDLEECFREIYGVEQPGSKAEKISKARNQFAAAGEAVFMIGDSMSDIRAAIEASVISIGVGWGHQSVEMLIRAKADKIVDSPKELMKIFK